MRARACACKTITQQNKIVLEVINYPEIGKISSKLKNKMNACKKPKIQSSVTKGKQILQQLKLEESRPTSLLIKTPPLKLGTSIPKN